jgi:hypothetical protein
LGEVRPETDVHDWRAERTDFVGRRVRGAVNSIDVDRGGVLFLVGCCLGFYFLHVKARSVVTEDLDR